MPKQTQHKKPPPRKARDDSLYRHFNIIYLEDGSVSIICIHCPKYNKARVARFNSSQARGHLINTCTGISQELKQQLSQGTQAAKREAKNLALASSNNTVEEMRTSALIVPNAIDLTSPTNFDID
eukprot:scaffold155275_cov66-Cyclotella_meneghiniana.AAC.3